MSAPFTCLSGCRSYARYSSRRSVSTGRFKRTLSSDNDRRGSIRSLCATCVDWNSSGLSDSKIAALRAATAQSSYFFTAQSTFASQAVKGDSAAKPLEMQRLLVKANRRQLETESGGFACDFLDGQHVDVSVRRCPREVGTPAMACLAVFHSSARD